MVRTKAILFRKGRAADQRSQRNTLLRPSLRPRENKCKDAIHIWSNHSLHYIPADRAILENMLCDEYSQKTERHHLTSEEVGVVPTSRKWDLSHRRETPV